jgi:hypothetical protein
LVSLLQRQRRGFSPAACRHFEVVKWWTIFYVSAHERSFARSANPATQGTRRIYAWVSIAAYRPQCKTKFDRSFWRFVVSMVRII